MVPPVLFYQDIREKKIFTFLFTLIQDGEWKPAAKTLRISGKNDNRR